MQKAVITGITGFVGSALARRLLSDGVKVYGVGRKSNILTELNAFGDFVPVQASFSMYGRLHEMIDETGFDMFWHLAWQGTSTSTSAYNDYDIQVVNIQAACDAAVLARRLNCKCVAACGSYYQYCRTGESLLAAWNPSIYGICKQSGSDLFKAIANKNDMPCRNLIFPNIIGVGDKPNAAVLFFIKRLLEDEPLNLISGEHPDDWIDIKDLVEGIISAAIDGKDNVDYYIGHRKISTFKEKLLEMKAILGSSSDLMFGTYPETHRVDYSKIDTEALHRDTGFEPKISFAKSVQDTAEWLRKRM